MKTHQRKSLKNKINFKDAITLTHELMNHRVEEDIGEIKNTTAYFRQWQDVYERFCRKEVTLSIEVASKLRCYYTHNDNPFLRIAPFKVEEVFGDPKILIFHDVLSDSEIEALKKLTSPKLTESLYYDFNEELQRSDLRSNKKYDLNEHDDKECKFVRDLNERITDITSLAVETEKIMQVMNYGIGGQFIYHYDFLPKKMAEKERMGNRIATLQFYMSDANLGGSTVFPKLNVTVSPKKGTAIFWYNLHRNGELDLNTIHAACPVLVGSKWITNKWFHERGQEFTRPCSLSNV